MRKLASLSIAVIASFVLAGAASAAVLAGSSMLISGSNTPGTNTYTITLTFATADQVTGYAVSTDTTGTYTGVFTEPVVAGFAGAIAGPVVTPASTGVAGSWGAVAGVNGPQPGGTYTIGTVQITVGAGQTVGIFLSGVDGILANSTTLTPESVNTITIIPEPTTASLLGLGIVGLIIAGRKSRA